MPQLPTVPAAKVLAPSIHLPAPTMGQIAPGRAVQLQTHCSFLIGAGLVQTLLLSMKASTQGSRPDHCRMDTTFLLPFAELSPTQASEGPTSRTLTASVQDGESKLLGFTYRGLVESSIHHLPSRPHHPLPLHEADAAEIRLVLSSLNIPIPWAWSRCTPTLWLQGADPHEPCPNAGHGQTPSQMYPSVVLLQSIPPFPCFSPGLFATTGSVGCRLGGIAVW